MAEPKIETIELVVEPEVEVEKTSRLKAFKTDHPRVAKVVGIAAITAVTLGAVSAWKSYRQEDNETETEDDNDTVVPFENSSETA